MACRVAGERTNAQTRLIGQELNQLRVENPRLRVPACKSGCSFCCCGHVSVLPIEAFHIAVSSRPKSPRDGTGDITEKVEAYLGQVSHLSLWERSQKVIPCAFLGEVGECRIYSERPLVCRLHHSVDAGKCEQNLSNPSVAVPQIPVFAERILPILAGLHQGCLESGLVSRNLPLVDAVSTFLKEGTCSAWLQGEDVFTHIEVDSPDSHEDGPTP